MSHPIDEQAEAPNPIDEQIERLHAAVDLFQQTHGRVPTLALDADGVIYDFETPYLAHHNAMNPDLAPVTGPFERFDVGYGRSPEVAEALQESMRSLDWTELRPYPEALAVIPVLAEVGIDLSVATAHRVDNPYSPAAKVHQFHHDFDGFFDTRLLVGIDKTRVVADFLVDDKPEVTGALVPQWQHLRFTQPYNRDLAGIHVTWETMFEVLAAAIEAKAEGRTLTPLPAVTTVDTDTDTDTDTAGTPAQGGTDWSVPAEHTWEELIAPSADAGAEWYSEDGDAA